MKHHCLNISCSLVYNSCTYIDLREDVYKTTSLIGGAAESAEYTEPLTAERVTAGRQLSTKDRHLIQPEKKTETSYLLQ